MRETRSPLRDAPLRLPGQSLDEQLNELLYERVFPWIQLPVVALFMAGLEWWRWAVGSPPHPWELTGFALGFAALGWWRVRRFIPQLRALKQGRDGERAVGHELENLRSRGCHVLHDVPGHRGNIDHVVVAPSGIYAIETKTFSKPVERDARIRFSGQAIEMDGRDIAGELLAQAAAERDDLQRTLKEMTGRDLPVRSVIVFPGWYVETVGDWRKSPIWVLNPRMLPGFLDHEPTVLTPEEMALAHATLATYVRQSARL